MVVLIKRSKAESTSTICYTIEITIWNLEVGLGRRPLNSAPCTAAIFSTGTLGPAGCSALALVKTMRTRAFSFFKGGNDANQDHPSQAVAVGPADQDKTWMLSARPARSPSACGFARPRRCPRTISHLPLVTCLNISLWIHGQERKR